MRSLVFNKYFMYIFYLNCNIGWRGQGRVDVDFWEIQTHAGLIVETLLT